MARLLLAGICLLLAAVSIFRYRSDERLRERARALAAEIELPLRRPGEAEAMALEPAGDLAAAVVARATLDDLRQPFRGDRVSPRVKRSWNSFFQRRKRSLGIVRELMLDAMDARPGWFNPRLLLGEVARAAVELRPIPAPIGAMSREALRAAAVAAPGVDAAWVAWARASLEDWANLSVEERQRLPELLRRAFLDEGFVTSDFLHVRLRLGAGPAMRLLPDQARPLAAARAIAGQSGDMASVAEVQRRLEAAEWRKRVSDLVAIEKRVSARDVENAWWLCVTWTLEHRIIDYDERPGRIQVARLLEIWPRIRAGRWDTDPRATIIMFFLNGRLADAPVKAMERILESLSDVPSSVQARVKLAAGDREGASELAESSVGDASLDWISFFVELSGHELARGRKVAARAALKRIATVNLDDCDVLLSRRTVARALGDRLEVAEVQRRLDMLSSGAMSREAWTSGGSLPLCVDPANPASRLLRVELRAEKPVLLSYGWDGGRLGTRVLQETGVLSVPLVGIQGGRMFWVEPVLGGPASPVAAVIGPER